jgi:hypothetical protein
MLEFEALVRARGVPMKRRILHAVVFKERDLWVAQCLEINLVSCATSLEELPEILTRQLNAQHKADLEAGREPFAKFKRAPEKYWRVYDSIRATTKPIKPRRTLSQQLKEIFTPPPVRAQLFPAAA